MWILWSIAWWWAPLPAGQVKPASTVFWVEVADHLPVEMARARADNLQTRRAEGNRLLQVLVLNPQNGEQPDARVWIGPFLRRIEAFSYGLSLLEDSRQPVFSFSLRRFDGVPVNLQVPATSRQKLKLSRVQPPWPQMGIVMFPWVGGYFSPQAKLPPLGAAVVRLGYRDEVWIQEETEVCEDGYCRRWFYAVTPAPHRLLWFPAGHVVPVSAIRSQKTSDGQVERYMTVLRTGTRPGNEACGLAMSFFGNRRPLRWVFCHRHFSEGRLVRQEDGSWGVFSSSGMIPLGKSPMWLPVESLFRSASRRQFF